MTRWRALAALAVLGCSGEAGAPLTAGPPPDTGLDEGVEVAAPDAAPEDVAVDSLEASPDAPTPDAPALDTEVGEAPPDACVATAPVAAMPYTSTCSPLAPAASRCGATTCTPPFGYRCSGGRPTLPAGVGPADRCVALVVGGAATGEICCPDDYCVRVGTISCSSGLQGWKCRAGGPPSGGCEVALSQSTAEATAFCCP